MRFAWPFLVLAAGCTSVAQPQSDWERANAARLGGVTADQQATPPPYPATADLMEFYVGPTVSFKFFVDRRSITLGRDKIVRYTMVARSPSGVENVSYEGMRCPDQSRVYAVGQTGTKTWTVRSGDWRAIPQGSEINPQHALARYFFCPHRDPVQSVAEAVGALEHGVHPAVEVQRSMGDD